MIYKLNTTHIGRLRFFKIYNLTFFRTTNCTPNDRTVRRRSWTFNLASTTPTDPLDRTVAAGVVVAAAEDVAVAEAASDVKTATAETEVTAATVGTEEAAETVVVIAEAIVAADQVEEAEASEER